MGKNKREKKRNQHKKNIKRSRRVGFNHHQSKTPTLASEQRNARHLNHHVGCPQNGQTVGQQWPHDWKASGPLEPKRPPPSAADRRTSRNGRSEKNKPQTPGVPLEESIGSSLKLPLGREGAFKA